MSNKIDTVHFNGNILEITIGLGVVKNLIVKFRILKVTIQFDITSGFLIIILHYSIKHMDDKK